MSDRVRQTGGRCRRVKLDGKGRRRKKNLPRSEIDGEPGSASGAVAGAERNIG